MLYGGGLEFWEQFAAGVRPEPPLHVDQWAEDHMRIPQGAGAEHGKYHAARTPYAVGVMQALSPGHPARRVVAMVGSQLFKTQVALNWICSVIHSQPANILTLLPTISLAKRVSSRVSKTISAIPEVRAVVAEPRSRDARNTIDTKEFLGGTLYLTTAGSAANLAEVPVRYLYGDEIDRWDVDVGGEGDPIDLAEARLSTFGHRAKIYYTSTPTLDGASKIQDLWKESNQQHYWIPCPSCGEFQTLVWGGLRWLKGGGDVHYECAHCHGKIKERDKPQFLSGGEWRPSADGDGETWGFTLSALYAPHGWTGWASLARKWEKAKLLQDRGDPTSMQVFVNTRLALPFSDTTSRILPTELQKRAEDYRLGTIPQGACIVTTAVDVQVNRLELLSIAWGPGLECWVCDQRLILSDPRLQDTWKRLDEVLKRPFTSPSGLEVVASGAGIDSGGAHTQEVYAFTRGSVGKRWISLKGSSKSGRSIIASRPSPVDVTISGNVMKAGAAVWMVGTDTAKDWLFHRLKQPGHVHFSNQLEFDFYEQLVAERRVIVFTKGFPKVEWRKANAARNESWDLLVYNLAVAHFLGLHRYRDADWDRAKENLVKKAGPEEREPRDTGPVRGELKPRNTRPLIRRSRRDGGLSSW